MRVGISFALLAASSERTFLLSLPTLRMGTEEFKRSLLPVVEIASLGRVRECFVDGGSSDASKGARLSEMFERLLALGKRCREL